MRPLGQLFPGQTRLAYLLYSWVDPPPCSRKYFTQSYAPTLKKGPEGPFFNIGYKRLVALATAEAATAAVAVKTATTATGVRTILTWASFANADGTTIKVSVV